MHKYWFLKSNFIKLEFFEAITGTVSWKMNNCKANISQSNSRTFICFKNFLKFLNILNVYQLMWTENHFNRNTWNTKCSIKTKKKAKYCAQASALR